MSEKSYLSGDSSILYRCNQKYFDKLLSKYDIGYTHMLLLTEIYENEGISMNELAIQGCFDKGTITKSVQKLEDLGYVRIENSEIDKRAKLLFTTDKTQEVVPSLYQMRSEWNSYLSSGINSDELDAYNIVQAKLIEKAKEYSKVEIESEIKFYGLQKLTLLDFPGKMAATVFTGGCNFRCPFCHNRSLVFLNENDSEISQDDILDYLKGRAKILDGVAITGGEPTLHKGLRSFIEKVRELGLKVKLDTNGTNFNVLKQLVEDGLVDYVAMDIKNCKDKYNKTVDLVNYDLSEIEKSVQYLLEDHVDYEFRTTIVKQFHEVEDIEKLSKWINGAKRYYLQNFEDHGSCIQEGLQAVDLSTIKQMKDVARPYVEHIEIRGVEE